MDLTLVSQEMLTDLEKQNIDAERKNLRDQNRNIDDRRRVDFMIKNGTNNDEIERYIKTIELRTNRIEERIEDIKSRNFLIKKIMAYRTPA